MPARILTDYILHSPKLRRPHTVLVVADLHNAPYADILPMLAGADLVAVPGDLAHTLPRQAAQGLAFLREAARRAPVCYALGNHEHRCDAAYRARVRETGVLLLENACQPIGELLVGGVGIAPDAAMLADMGAQSAFTLLLCHQPERFFDHIQPHAIDLTLAGHAHGGQMRVLGRALYAPNQGLLPRWTQGFYAHERLLVSRGATNSAHPVPRIGVPCEVLRLRLLPA